VNCSLFFFALLVPSCSWIDAEALTDESGKLWLTFAQMICCKFFFRDLIEEKISGGREGWVKAKILKPKTLELLCL
jgi:hypothetical protein